MEYYLAHMVILTSLGLSSSTILPFSIFQALGKLITFIHNEYRNMNIDGQFGLAQAQANLDIALQQMRACNNQSLVTKIRDTRDEIEVIRNLVNPLLKEHPFKYFVFKYIFSNPKIWTKDLGYKTGNFSSNQLLFSTGPFQTDSAEGFYKYLEASTFSEEDSDDCIVEIVAHIVHGIQGCPVSRQCYELMIKMPNGEYMGNLQGYGATHRLLYLQITRAMSCKQDEKQTRESIRQYCGYIYWEFKKLLQYQMHTFYTDLLLEQFEMCGYEGYLEFFNEVFMDFLLKQQTPQGCYGNEEVENRREVTMMKYGCNSHTSGLAAVSLAIALRYTLVMKKNCEMNRIK